MTLLPRPAGILQVTRWLYRSLRHRSPSFSHLDFLSPLETFHPYTRYRQEDMGAKNKGGGETSKKAQGQARKADAAASKKAAKEQQAESSEAVKWEKGTKSNAKAYVVHGFFFSQLKG